MSWGVKTTCLEAPGVSLGGSGVSIGGVGSLRVEGIPFQSSSVMWFLWWRFTKWSIRTAPRNKNDPVTAIICILYRQHIHYCKLRSKVMCSHQTTTSNASFCRIFSEAAEPCRSAQGEPQLQLASKSKSPLSNHNLGIEVEKNRRFQAVWKWKSR